MYKGTEITLNNYEVTRAAHSVRVVRLCMNVQYAVVMYDIHRLGICEGCLYTLLKVVHLHICALCDTLPTHVILLLTRSHV